MTFMKKYLNVDVENVECTKLMSKIAEVIPTVTDLKI